MPSRLQGPTAVMLTLGVLALAATGWQVRRTILFSQAAAHVTGIITDPAPHPCIRFTDSVGVAHEFTQNGFVSRPLGATVPVAYDPQDPGGTAQAWTFWTSWGTALWLLPMGLGFTLLPLFGYRAQVGWR